jgi:hypothetical protein
MKKVIILSITAFTIATIGAPLRAQTPPLDRQLEVTRAYTPKVGQASKLAVEPNMTDTVRLDPEGDFVITPTAWPASFPAEKYKPARMSTASFSRHRPLYIRAGAGYAPRSTFDLYWTPYLGNGSSLSIFVNHRGSYSKIVNDIGIRSDAAETINGLGLAGARKVGRQGRFTLDGDVFYENRYYSYYGSGDDLTDDDMRAVNTLRTAIDPFAVPLTTRRRANFAYDRENDTYFIGKAGGSIGFGNAFTDLSRLNFRVDIGSALTHYLSSLEQADVDLSTRLAMMPHRNHGFEMVFSERTALDARGWNFVPGETRVPVQNAF